VTVVVGIDGSPGSVAALQLAVAEAKLRKTDVKAVMAWHAPTVAYETRWVAAQLDPATFQEAAASVLNATVSEADTSGVQVDVLVVHGQAAEVLVNEARDADRLVVGSRGLGGFRGLLLGSVSQQCAQHATCPVVIVPHPHDRQTG